MSDFEPDVTFMMKAFWLQSGILQVPHEEYPEQLAVNASS